MSKAELADDYIRIPAIMSFAFESIVVLTVIIFRDLRKLKYMQLVCFISLGSMIGTIGLLLGYVGNNENLCNLQAILTNYGFISSGFWTVVNAWQLFKVVYTSHIIDDATMFRLHIFIWLFPLFVSILPFTWVSHLYGDDDDNHYSVWCFVSASAPDAEFLEFFTFWFWILLSIAAMLILLMSITYRVRRHNLSPAMKGNYHDIIMIIISLLFYHHYYSIIIIILSSLLLRFYEQIIRLSHNL